MTSIKNSLPKNDDQGRKQSLLITYLAKLFKLALCEVTDEKVHHEKTVRDMTDHILKQNNSAVPIR